MVLATSRAQWTSRDVAVGNTSRSSDCSDKLHTVVPPAGTTAQPQHFGGSGKPHRGLKAAAVQDGGICSSGKTHRGRGQNGSGVKGCGIKKHGVLRVGEEQWGSKGIFGETHPVHLQLC